MPARYELTPAAKEDVRGIWLYTAAQWGERQADRYVSLLEAGFRKIASRRAVSRTFSERYPQVRVTRCEHRYVFFLHPEGQKPRILAVLHENMNLLARLGDRLSP
jgi:toxin ParE1/3/4